jgi:hypothetical protein
MTGISAQRPNSRQPRRHPKIRKSQSQRRNGRVAAPLQRWTSTALTPMLRTLLAPPVLTVLLIAIPALFLTYQYQRPHRIDVGEGNDTFYLRGAFATENGAGTDFRWISDIGEIVIPDAPGNSLWDATLRLSGERPTGLIPPLVEVRADDHVVARFETIQAFQDYSFRFSRSTLPPDELRLTITSATFDPPGEEDNRPLGVALDDVTLTPARDSANEPFIFPVSYAATVLGLLAGVAALLGYLGLSTVPIAAILGLGLGGILLGQYAQPDISAAYFDNLLFVLVVLIVVTLVLRPLVRRLFAAGGVPLGQREEGLLCGLFFFGAACHLAGVFFPGFGAHDIIFQTHRVEDVLRGNALLSTISSEWGYRRTPYPPALYVLLAPLSAFSNAVLRDTALPLRLVPPIFDATSVFLIFYLLRRCRVPDPAPALAAACYTLIPATFQLLWWGFYSNLFGQWATLVALTLAVAHYSDLARPKFFAALTVVLSLALLSHPGTFVLTVTAVPLLALILFFANGRAERRNALAIGAALTLAGAIVFALYYRHFTDLVFTQARELIAGSDTGDAPPEAPGWELAYIRNRLFVFPFAAYFTITCLTALGLLRRAGRERTIGWLITAIVLTSAIFAAVHVGIGVWVRYFVFLAPALAIGLGVGLAWLVSRGRWARGLAALGLAYCAASSLIFWFGVTAAGGRSPYP